MFRSLPVAGLLAGLLLGSSHAHAAQDASLGFSGSVRLRYESLDGQYRTGFGNRDDQFNARTMLRLDWRKGAWQLVGELHDSRAWESGTPSVLSATMVNTLEPVQAYVRRQFSDEAGHSGSLDIGRFTMNVGSRRLVASDDFRNTSQGYTGVRGALRTAGNVQWDAFYVLPQQARPGDLDSLRDGDWHLDHEGQDLQLWGVVAARPGLLPGGALGEAGYVGLRERDHGAHATRDRNLHSFTLRALREPAAGGVDYEVEYIHQSGHISASTAPGATRQDVQAGFVHAEAGYTRRDAWRTHLSLELDHASGDSPGGNHRRFDSLFGMRRADLAPSGIFGAVGRTNVQALGMRVEVTPSSRMDAFISWRLLRAAEATDSFSTSGIRDATGDSGRHAGHLFDARLRYWLIPRQLRAEVNATWLRRGRMLREAPNASPWGDTHYATVALTYGW